MASVVLVRYGELALKSPAVRKEFEQALRRNILRAFVTAGLDCRIRSDRGHLYVEVGDARAATTALRRVFGVTSVSEVWPVRSDPEEIERGLLELAGPVLAPSSSFAIRARRTGRHPFTSQDLARRLGTAVLTTFADRSLRVDLDRPQVELSVEVRDQVSYLSLGRLRGPGGLPVGVAGRAAALVDGRRGALGAYLMMKRGCRTSLVATPAGETFARSVLLRFDPDTRVTAVSAEPSDWRTMLSEVAVGEHADAVVLPLAVDDYPGARTEWGDRVVFSPTVGLDDAEVEERWRAIEALAE